MVASQRWGSGLGWVALSAWMGLRTFSDGVPIARFGLPGGALTFLTLDGSWLLLAAALGALCRWPPSPRASLGGGLALAASVVLQCFSQAAARYYHGDARAWDLANYVQPMWRAAQGLEMVSGTYDGRPVWADHGAFAMLAFAPFTRLGADPATGVLAVQAVCVGGAVLAAFGLARAHALSPAAALAVACVVASSRALISAARFDFHAECALGVLLLGGAWALAKGASRRALCLTLAGACTRDMAAFTVAGYWLYVAVWPPHRGARAFAVTGVALCALIATLDVALLPRLTGWPSYFALHGSRPVDLSLAAQTTLWRSLSSFGLGWLHPVAWLAGAPWIAAAAASPKLIVKGIDYQYGFLFVPVAVLGAVHVLSWTASRMPSRSTMLTCAWAVGAVAVNAPPPGVLAQLPELADRHAAIRTALTRQVPATASVLADACAAPYVMAHAELRVLCRLDAGAMVRDGVERWDEPVAIPAHATHVVLRARCPAAGPCFMTQVRRAQELGFGAPQAVGPFLVLRREGGAARGESR